MRHGIQLLILAAAAFLNLSACASGARKDEDTFAATDLQCEALTDPLAIDSTSPHFSWKLSGPSGREGQGAWQILVATSEEKLNEADADLWNSGKVEDGNTLFIEYAGRPLPPRALAYWRVRVWDINDAEGEWSEPARFGVGLLSEEDWDPAARFIGAHQEDARAEQTAELLGDRAKDINSTRLLRKVFECHKGKDLMLLHVNSLGYHEVWVNGSKVSDAVLAPAVSQLGKRSLVLTYDVGPFLKNGTNDLVLWLGDGWYHDYLEDALPGGPFVRAELDAVSPDGSRTVLTTDSSWEALQSGRLTFGNWKPHQMGGEVVDKRMTPSDLSPKTLSKLESIPVLVADVPSHKASPQMCETNVIKESFHPLSVTKAEDGCFVYDFGRCFVGLTQVDIPVVGEGQVIELHYDDTFFKADPKFRDGLYTDFYIGDGKSPGAFSSKFNYKGYRFLKIKGLDTVLPLESITGSSVSTAYRGDASFACSDKDMNDIFEMVSGTLGALTLGGYMVDCPQIERLGYGGDGNASTPTVQTLFNLAPLYSNWMQAWADCQRPNGDLPHTAPNPYSAGGGPFWCAFLIDASWQTYLNYGDPRLIERYYPQMEKWLAFAQNNRKDGLLKHWGFTQYRNWYLGDWATPEGIDQTDQRSVDLVSNCVLSDCLATMSKISDVLGKYEESQRYLDLHDELNALIHKTFFDKKSCSYSTGAQIDQVYPMLVGATPENEVDAVREALLERTETVYGGHLSTGLVGVPVLTDWAIRNGDSDFIYKMLKKRDYPGYLYMVDNGATMTWEHWNGARSHIHNCYNGIGRWFIQSLAGLRMEESAVGYKSIFINPHPVDGIAWAEASKDCPFGPVRVRWEREGEWFTLEAEIPLGTTATLELPYGLCLVSVATGEAPSGEAGAMPMRADASETLGEASDGIAGELVVEAAGEFGSDLISLLPGRTLVRCKAALPDLSGE